MVQLYLLVQNPFKKNKMDKEKIDMEVSRRNAMTVLETLNRQNLAIAEQQKRIDGLNASISGLIQRIESLEKQIAMQKVKTIGSGPTVR